MLYSKVDARNIGKELTVRDLLCMDNRKVIVQVPKGIQQVFTVLDGAVFSDNYGTFWIRDGLENMRLYFEYVDDKSMTA